MTEQTVAACGFKLASAVASRGDRTPAPQWAATSLLVAGPISAADLAADDGSRVGANRGPAMQTIIAPASKRHWLHKASGAADGAGYMPPALPGRRQHG